MPALAVVKGVGGLFERLLLIAFFVGLLLVAEFAWEVCSLGCVPGVFGSLSKVCGLGICQGVEVDLFGRSEVSRRVLVVLGAFVQGQFWSLVGFLNLTWIVLDVFVLI